MKEKKFLFLFETYGDYCNGNYERFKHFKTLTNDPVKKLNIRNLFKKKGRKYFFNFFIDLISRNKIDIVVFANAPWMYLNTNQIYILKNICNIIYIVDDCEEYFEWHQLPFAKFSDKVLVHDYKDVSLFSNHNIDSVFFPQPSLLTDILKSNPIDYKSRKIDIFFLGRSDRPGRKNKYYNFSKISESVYFKYSNLEKTKITNQEKLKIMLDSKIHINFSAASSNNSYFSSFKNNKISNNLKGRVFEAILSESLIVTENSPGIEEIFDIPNSIFTFNDDHEIEKILDKILNNNIDVNQYLINSRKSISKFFEKDYYDDCLYNFKDSSYQKINIFNQFYIKYLKVFIAKESLRLFLFFVKKLKFKSAYYELKNFFYHFNFYFFVYIYYYLKVFILSKIS